MAPKTGPRFNQEFLRNGSPTGTFVENIPRWAITTDTAGPATSTGSVTGQKLLAQTSGSTLTTTAPATITSATASALVPYAVVT